MQLISEWTRQHNAVQETCTNLPQHSVAWKQPCGELPIQSYFCKNMQWPWGNGDEDGWATRFVREDPINSFDTSTSTLTNQLTKNCGSMVQWIRRLHDDAGPWNQPRMGFEKANTQITMPWWCSHYITIPPSMLNVCNEHAKPSSYSSASNSVFYSALLNRLHNYIIT